MAKRGRPRTQFYLVEVCYNNRDMEVFRVPSWHYDADQSLLTVVSYNGRETCIPATSMHWFNAKIEEREA